ncbi:hypothetical protein GUJ93_ZPchr0002g25042 [Zizania palustris]|uniref:Uncharacterized protein n=1 Tax=Zizania palustris TaxID=103762 RepID=A0A8J5SFD6_ZIZPA|nr:hypothetical protein GUJ93_ZPchr0002g25042 [Zizania palustris]
MSGQSVADDNSGKKDDDPITTILNRLGAIEDMMRPLLPLAGQVAAIEITLHDQIQQQQLLSADLLRVEHGQAGSKAPPAGSRRQMDD